MMRWTFIFALLLALGSPQFVAASPDNKPSCCPQESDCAQGLKRMACCNDNSAMPRDAVLPLLKSAAVPLEVSSFSAEPTGHEFFSEVSPIPQPNAGPPLYLKNASWLI